MVKGVKLKELTPFTFSFLHYIIHLIWTNFELEGHSPSLCIKNMGYVRDIASIKRNRSTKLSNCFEVVFKVYNFELSSLFLYDIIHNQLGTTHMVLLHSLLQYTSVVMMLTVFSSLSLNLIISQLHWVKFFENEWEPYRL